MVTVGSNKWWFNFSTTLTSTQKRAFVEYFDILHPEHDALHIILCHYPDSLVEYLGTLTERQRQLTGAWLERELYEDYENGPCEFTDVPDQKEENDLDAIKNTIAEDFNLQDAYSFMEFLEKT